MEALAERIARKGVEARQIVAPEVRKQDLPAALTVNQVDAITSQLTHAGSMLSMLIHVFGGQSSLDDVRGRATSEMVMGLVQHADHQLTRAYNEITEIDGKLPDEVRPRIFEAQAIVALLERIGFAGGFEYDAFSDQYIVDYLSAAQECIDQTNAGVQAHWGQQNA